MELEGSASILRKAFYLKHLPTGAGGLAYDFPRFVRLPLVPYGQDKSARLDFRGSDARNPAKAK